MAVITEQVQWQRHRLCGSGQILRALWLEEKAAHSLLTVHQHVPRPTAGLQDFLGSWRYRQERCNADCTWTG